jgi:hypothetical protein
MKSFHELMFLAFATINSFINKDATWQMTASGIHWHSIRRRLLGLARAAVAPRVWSRFGFSQS